MKWALASVTARVLGKKHLFSGEFPRFSKRKSYHNYTLFTISYSLVLCSKTLYLCHKGIDQLTLRKF